MASSSSPGPCTLEMPTLDPARAGLTNTGKPSAATVSRTAALSVAQARGVTTAYGPDRQAGTLQQGLHVPLVHGGRRREHPGPDVGHAGQLEQSLQRAVLAVGAVQQRQDDVDLAELLGHRPRLVDGEPAVGRVAREHDRGAVAGHLGQLDRR